MSMNTLHHQYTYFPQNHETINSRKKPQHCKVLVSGEFVKEAEKEIMTELNHLKDLPEKNYFSSQLRIGEKPYHSKFKIPFLVITASY